MNLFKWRKNLKPNFPNVIEKFFGNKIDEHAEATESIATVPSVNITDKQKFFELSVAVPGFDKKDLKLEVKDQCLIISSEKQYKKDENEGNWMRREFGYASFQRMFQLPDNADPKQIAASMRNGVLKIKVGKLKGHNSGRKIVSVR